MEDIFGQSYDSTPNPYMAFQHGLVSSKLWLCEELENIIQNKSIKNPDVYIFGAWHNVLSFMMITRKPKLYSVFHCYDKDLASIDISNKICDTWQYEYPRVLNHHKDVNQLDFTASSDSSIFINCSVDQFDGTEWYNKIPRNRLVCLQSTDLPVGNTAWEITQSYNLVSDLTDTYKLRNLFYANTRCYDYGHVKYKRHTVIGIK